MLNLCYRHWWVLLIVTLSMGYLFKTPPYPFARFPMYNEFPNEAFIYWISDEQGSPIALESYYEFHPHRLSKKVVSGQLKIRESNSNISDEQRKMMSGEIVLEQFVSSLKGPAPFLSVALYEEKVFFNEGRVTTQKTKLAEMRGANED